MTPPVTVTRSCSENVERCSDTGVTLTFAVSASPIGTGVSITPSGSRTPSAPCQPAALKIGDEDHLAPRQRRLARDAARQLQRRTVARRAGSGLPRATAAFSRPRSGVDRSATSAPDAKNTIDARSDGADLADRIARRRGCARPAIAVRHAVGPVDQDDDFARAATRPRPQAPAAARTAARTPRRSAPAPRAAAAAAASCGSRRRWTD